MQQILDHMNESGVYNESDLDPFHRRIAELRQIIKNDEEFKRHPKAMIKLLERQLKDCGTFTHIKLILTSLHHHTVANTTTDGFGSLYRCSYRGDAGVALRHLS